MARPLRIVVENGWYHVFGRGTERRAIFTTDRGREHFIELLAEMHDRYRVVIHAYALLENHYHAIFQTPDANLAQAMQWLHGSYSTWFNVKHERVGPLFQGRYKAVPVENSAWAYALSLYVHLNPLRIAGLGLDKQGRVLEGKGFRNPSREQVTERLKRLRAYPSDARDRLRYGVESSRIERLCDTVAIGSAAFAKGVRELGVASQLRGVGGKRQLRRRVPIKEVRSGVEALRGESWATIRGSHGDWGRGLFLSTARRLCGLTLKEIGAAAGGMDEAAVGIAVRRFNQKLPGDSSLKARQHALLQMLDVRT